MIFSPIFILASLLPVSQQEFTSERLNVLYIGDRGHHDPFSRLRDVWGPLARQGIAVEWEENLDSITPRRLRSFDCVLMYANQPQHEKVPEDFFNALSGFVKDGGGFVALHCTSGCFMQSQKWLEFVGARFVSHGAEIFQQTLIEPNHPILRGWENFESWDETYVQSHFDGDRTVLALRDEEPWMWVRNEGQGRVFYCASGHDERTWREPAFLDLLTRAVDWASGETAAAKRAALKLPAFDYEERDFVPNYEDRSPRMKYQLPSTPTQAKAHFQPPAGMTVELFAAEPMVINPIAMDWDLRGRCWVIETPNYPNQVLENSGSDRISILEDTDGDGQADKKTIFAEGLNLPTGLLKVEGGLIVAMAPNLLLFLDKNEDDKVDQIQSLASGFGRFDTHAGPSNLVFGPDNAIWGAVGYSAFTRADGSKFGSGLWKWDSSQEEPEFLAQFTNNTWGLGIRADGEVFGSTANGAPSFFMGANKLDLAKSNPNHAGAAPVHDSAWVFPSLAEIRQGDWLGQYTSAAGHAFATGSMLPESWLNRSAFICSPTAHTVGRFDTYPVDSGWKTRNAVNLCASTDEWFCPVQATVGPDGAIWIADFSQFIILHNLPGDPERGLPKIEYGDGSAHLNPMRDKEHGRIWRLVSKHSKPERPPFLKSSSSEKIISHLGHPNQFWRTSARRLIASKSMNEVSDSLFNALRMGTPLAVTEALRTFDAMGGVPASLQAEVFSFALQSSSPEILIAGLQALPKSSFGAEALLSSRLLEHPLPQVRRHALLAASRLPPSPAVGVSLVGRAVVEPPGDEWITVALQAAVASHGDSFLRAAAPLLESNENGPVENLFPNPGFERPDSADSRTPEGWEVRVYGGEADHGWSATGGRSGSRALKISSQSGADTSWCADISVKANSRYRMSGWVKTEGISHQGATHGALMNIHPTHEATTSVVDDSDWTQVTLEFDTGNDQTQISVNCLYGGWGKSTGSAYWDDVVLQRLGSVNGLAALVEVAKQHSQAFVGEKEKELTEEAAHPGDPARGREVFFQNTVLSCNRCHALEGQGGGIGPSLDGVGSRLTKDGLLQSIVDPNAVMAESWPASVSAMPALRSFMTKQELADLVSFLTDLKE
ncbi:MAG: ThuA domain-containing protein [Planctomycetota bacterium]|nr:ThuA domain-containing protein [Planctomycetota bacterium]